MKKLFLLNIMLWSVAVSSYAQTPWYMPVEYHKGKSFYFEVMAGGSFSDLRYVGSMYNQLDRSLPLFPAFGVAYRFQMPRHFSFAPTLAYESKGTSISDNIQYRLTARYLSFVLPWEYNKPWYPRSRSRSGYFVTLGPYAAVPFKGTIRYEDKRLPLTRANFNQYDLGAEVGAGIRLSTFSSSGMTNIRLKLSYSRGFIDTFSPMERGGAAKAINMPAYIIEGRRYNQTVKLTVSVEIPFEQKETVTFTAGGDGKRTFKQYVNIY